ncbi:MAG: cell envelope integrity protein CreD [Bacteroidales bacterium]|nr:cell envelope integrity protein CreD [Bacteroidales bacterium]MBN2818638.1 cell envelope integrity protein CreD [Bacteroidales bacterium]
METEKKENRNNFFNSISFKLSVIVVLSLILLIPSSMIKSLITERSYSKNEATREIAEKWGKSQIITGPILQVPYQKSYKLTDGTITTKKEYFFIFPSKLNINGDINTTNKHRGIYDVLIFGSDLIIKGDFNNTDFKEWPENYDKILWEDSRLIIGVSDLKGITQTASINWNDENIKLSPGKSNCFVLQNGVNAKINTLPNSINTFKINLKLNGSEKLYISPVANQTEFTLTSNWGHPSFNGSLLPKSSEISESSFIANWQANEMTRTFPQILSSESMSSNINFQESGVDLILPVDTYQKSTRSVKYAFLFIALTFLIMFFTEITSAKKIHPIQYLIVGIALVIFYSLLIALAEHIHFNYAYLIGSITIITMNTFFIHSIYKNKKTTLIISLTMSALYVYLFTILQIADYALLMGNIGLVLILGIVMIFSRKVDWYGTKKIKPNSNSADK